MLQYFKDRNSVKPKGTIDLNDCEQVDQGLSFETRKFLANAYIFDIVTPRRKYFLVASSEEDMIRWVRYICEACGFHLDGAEQEGMDNWWQTVGGGWGTFVRRVGFIYRWWCGDQDSMVS